MENHEHHSHQHTPTNVSQRRLVMVLGLVGMYMIAEVIGGILTGSLALLADAGHMLSDVAALALAVFALWIAERPAPSQHTFGYYRAEILAALVNGATLIATAIVVWIEAVKRWGSPPEVQGGLMFGVASGGLIINLLGLWILNQGKESSLNVHGAWLHVLTDALGSVGAMAAGALIWAFGWRWVDPAVSMLIGGLVLYSAWNLMKATMRVLMESAPEHLDVDAVRTTILAVPGVQAVHDLHVWTIRSGLVALSAHVTVPPEADTAALLATLRDRLHTGFQIDHATIQCDLVGSDEPALII